MKIVIPTDVGTLTWDVSPNNPSLNQGNGSVDLIVLQKAAQVELEEEARRSLPHLITKTLQLERRLNDHVTLSEGNARKTEEARRIGLSS